MLIPLPESTTMSETYNDMILVSLLLKESKTLIPTKKMVINKSLISRHIKPIMTCYFIKSIRNILLLVVFIPKYV